MLRKSFVFIVMVIIIISASAQSGVNGKGGEPGYDNDGGSGWGGLIIFFLIVGGIGYLLDGFWKKQDSRKAEELRAKDFKEKEALERKERERKEDSKITVQIQKKDKYAELIRSTIRIGELEIMTKDLGYLSFNEAYKICQDLGNGWRLPTKEELNLLYENKGMISGFKSHYSAFYISSTDYKDLSGFVWIKGFERGESGCFTKDDVRYVRLVRTY